MSALHASPKFLTFRSLISFSGLKRCSLYVRPYISQLSPLNSSACIRCASTWPADGGADPTCCAVPPPPKACDVIPKKTSAADIFVVCRTERIGSDIPLMTVSVSQNEIHL